MSKFDSYRIEASAARALTEWKFFFSEQVTRKARELAAKDGPTSTISLQHYQQAAEFAADLLVSEVQKARSDYGDQKAA